ncbi:hypothetical protein GCM10010245_83670 [Streptomyces spectabilis]|nr:hypothetical protein GCM10010245_83670 [Streptomyces spectabilis]
MAESTTPVPAPKSSPEAQAPATAQELLAVACWLAEADPSPGRVWAQWERYGVALLPLGSRFDALRIPPSGSIRRWAARKRRPWPPCWPPGWAGQ